MQLNPSLLAGPGNTGSMPATAVEDLMKALEAGYGTDVSMLTGGGALRIQSLDTVMQATIQENQNFRLFNRLPKPKAGATVDEWTEMSSVGGFLGGSSNTEVGMINNATGSYARRVGMVKYLSTMRQVSLVTQISNNITDAEGIEYHAGAMQLLSDAEFFSFEGDSRVVPTEFDGIYTQISEGVAGGEVDTANVIDVRGVSLNSVGYINSAAATISGYGNFGTPTDIFTSQLTQADFDTGLDPAFRVPLADVPGGGIQLGAPVAGIRTSWGNIKNNPDVFVRDPDQKQPFDVMYPMVATGNAAFTPAAVAVSAAMNVSSLFGAPQAGNYYYLVAGVNSSGQSTGFVTAQVAVAAGNAVTLTITRSASMQETGYVIYRSRMNGGNSIAGSVPGQGSDFRQMVRIPCAGATTTYVDLNYDIPGTTMAYVLNMAASATAITWRQLLPMVKFPLYPTNAAVIPWAQLLFGYLRISKRRQHVCIKNVLPNSAVWRPFG